MYKRLIFLMSLFLLSSCANFGPQGIVYGGRDAGLVVHNGVKPVKTGSACLNSFLTLITSGNASINQAKTNGHITQVASVSYHVDNYLLYQRYCTVVHGE